MWTTLFLLTIFIGLWEYTIWPVFTAYRGRRHFPEQLTLSEFRVWDLLSLDQIRQFENPNKTPLFSLGYCMGYSREFRLDVRTLSCRDFRNKYGDDVWYGLIEPSTWSRLSHLSLVDVTP